MTPFMAPQENNRLTLPVAAMAQLTGPQPFAIRECVMAAQSYFCDAAFMADHAPADRRERWTHETEARRELLIDAWMEAIYRLPSLSPLPVPCEVCGAVRAYPRTGLCFGCFQGWLHQRLILSAVQQKRLRACMDEAFLDMIA